MNQRTLGVLVATLLVVGGVYCFLDPSKKAGEPADVLSGIDGENIAKIMIEQGANSIEISDKEGTWVLPSRADYPADSTKIRALLLKIFDLSASQKVPSGDAGIKKLGLDEDGVKNNQRARIVLSDKSGAELGGVFLGENRKSERNDSPGPRMSITGQYVRPINSKAVYLISTPVTVSPIVSEWIDTALISIAGVKPISVSQYRSAQGVTNQSYKLSLSTAGDGKLLLDGSIPAGEEIQDAVISQVSGALENLRIVDVQKADSETAKALNFDETITYELQDGSVYSVSTGKSGEKTSEKYYLKVEVSVDDVRATELKSVYEKALEEYKKKSEELKAANKQDELSKLVEPKLEAATKESVAAINTRLAPWIFESASYQAQKFRKSREDFFKKKEKPKN